MMTSPLSKLSASLKLLVASSFQLIAAGILWNPCPGPYQLFSSSYSKYEVSSGWHKGHFSAILGGAEEFSCIPIDPAHEQNKKG
jgi:hypothetical protein